MARKPAWGSRTGWRTIASDPARVAPLLREAGFIGCDDEPTECRTTFDASGRPRRVHARFASGWRCTVSFRSDNSYSVSQALTIRVDRREPTP